MRRSAIIAGNPWTLLLHMEEDPDSLGCRVRFHEVTIDGETADAWEVQYDHISQALYEIEMAYGIGPEDWIEVA